MVPDALKLATPLVPGWIFDLNLLRVFLWYLLAAFIVSVTLRLRFYWSIYQVAKHVRDSCPNIYLLIHEHWFLCIKDGLIALTGLYVGVYLVYGFLNYFVWPRAVVTISELAAVHPTLVVVNLVLIGLMLTMDAVLIGQVSVIDADQIIRDMTWSERWLGGNLSRLLGFLGRWNPVKRYADAVAHQNFSFMNGIFRLSVATMITQLALRLCVAISLFASHVGHLRTERQHPSHEVRFESRSSELVAPAIDGQHSDGRL